MIVRSSLRNQTIELLVFANFNLCAASSSSIITIIITILVKLRSWRIIMHKIIIQMYHQTSNKLSLYSIILSLTISKTHYKQKTLTKIIWNKNQEMIVIIIYLRSFQLYSLFMIIYYLILMIMIYFPLIPSSINLLFLTINNN